MFKGRQWWPLLVTPAQISQQRAWAERQPGANTYVSSTNYDDIHILRPIHSKFNNSFWSKHVYSEKCFIVCLLEYLCFTSRLIIVILLSSDGNVRKGNTTTATSIMTNIILIIKHKLTTSLNVMVTIKVVTGVLITDFLHVFHLFI